MDWSKIVDDLDRWHDEDTAPKDGTPVLVDSMGALGVFAWETRPEFLPLTVFNKPMEPTWVGFFIVTEWNPVMKEGEPMPDRFIMCAGLDDGFKWRALPERHKTPASTRDHD